VVRVLLDASAIPAQHGGVGRYVAELADHLAGADADLHLAVQLRDRDLFAGVLGADRVHPLPGWAAGRPARMLWEQVGLPRLARRLGAEVVHSPHYTFPLLGGLPVAVTLHDATFFTTPQLHLRVKARFFRSWTRLAVRRAALLITPSRATAEEVERLLGPVRVPIAVIPHGVDRSRFHRPDPAAVDELRGRLDLPGEFLCFLGTLEPRKNVPALVSAWVAACADRADPPTLVLAGADGWDTQLDATLAQVPQRLRLVRPGFVPDELLPALLGAALMVCYPSLGEGFGLPVLEAMACGACVLTTRDLSLPEVGGDAVAYAASPAVADLAAALGDLLDDPDRRKVLGAKAFERAGTFSWQASADAHLAAYTRAAAEQPGRP
jgi:glycosyltransferase involved in cell wall biosynthesis